MKHFLLVTTILILSLSIAPAQEIQDALKLYSANRFAEAIEVCRRELEILPKNMDSYAVMGWSLVALGQYQEALAEAEKALVIAPYDHRMIEIKAEAMYHLGKNREALGYFEQYAAIAPAGIRISRVYYFMGEIFLRLGEYGNADMAFTTALYFDNKDARWWSRLGYAREIGEDYQWAKEAYENALKLNPNLVEAQKGLANVQRILSGQ